MKKIVALALTVVMVLGLLAGCGEKPMDAKTLTQKMDEAMTQMMKSAAAMEAKMEMDLGMNFSIPGMMLEMGMNLDADMKYKMDMSAGYMKMKMGLEVMGQTQEEELETYITMADGKYIGYSYNSAADQWVKSEQDMDAVRDAQEKLMGVSMGFGDIPLEKMTLAPEKETLNEKPCYVLTINMDGSYMKDALGALMGTLDMEEMTEEDKAMLEQMDWSAMNVKMVYHVDAATFNTVQLVAEVQGIGDVMNSMIADVMAEQMLGGAEGMDVSIDIPTFTVKMTEMKMQDVEIPAVPQEAIDNALTQEELMEDALNGENEFTEELSNPPQADGSYLLSLEHDAVSITVPEGYIVYVSEADMLAAMTEDMMNDISYMLMPEYTDEIIRGEFDTTVEVLQSMGMYESHAEGEKIGDYSVMDLVYVGGIAERYAWVEITDGILMVTVSGEGELPDMEALLSGIVIGE